MVVASNMFSNSLKTISVLLILCLGFFACSNNEESKVLHPVNMAPLSFQQWSSQLEKYQSKVIVLDMWAMWCVSCLERFPEMVKLHEKYQDKGVKFVSMNLDDRDDADSIRDAEKFLHKMNASFEHYRINENMIEAFEMFKLISIPAVIIYDHEGNERYRLTGDNPNEQFTEKEIESAIVSLLQ